MEFNSKFDIGEQVYFLDQVDGSLPKAGIFIAQTNLYRLCTPVWCR